MTAFAVRLVLRNSGEESVSIPNPDMGRPSPEMNWPWTQATYQTAMLLSFHLLRMTVRDADGRELEPEAIQTWATPVMLPRVVLQQGESLELTVPLGDFYDLAAGASYRVRLEYGDPDSRITAEAELEAS